MFFLVKYRVIKTVELVFGFVVIFLFLLCKFCILVPKTWLFGRPKISVTDLTVSFVFRQIRHWPVVLISVQNPCSLKNFRKEVTLYNGEIMHNLTCQSDIIWVISFFQLVSFASQLSAMFSVVIMDLCQTISLDPFEMCAKFEVHSASISWDILTKIVGVVERRGGVAVWHVKCRVRIEPIGEAEETEEAEVVVDVKSRGSILSWSSELNQKQEETIMWALWCFLWETFSLWWVPQVIFSYDIVVTLCEVFVISLPNPLPYANVNLLPSIFEWTYFAPAKRNLPANV